MLFCGNQRSRSITIRLSLDFSGIIKDRKIWATHTQYLNDRREFLHAVDLVREEIERLFKDKNTQTGQESAAAWKPLRECVICRRVRPKA